jgi:hypothetical protein
MHPARFKSYWLVLLLVHLFLSAYVNEQTRPLNIRIKNSEFKIDKLIVSNNWYLPPLKSKLGTPEKIIKGVNNTYTYTDLGLVLFEGIDSILNEIQIFYDLRNPTKVSPYAVYRGMLKIDKLIVDENLSKELMTSSLIKWNPGPSFSPHLYRAEKEGIYLYFEFTADEKNLVKVSIGRVKV